MNIIQTAAKKIQKGELVAFPTETVYGLGADATNNEACRKIYDAKGRPSNNPLIIHVSSKEAAYELGEITEEAQKIIDNFWPGPISIVVKRKTSSAICDIATAGLGTIALRMPNHDVALELIRESGVPIAAPSANKSNYLSPTEAKHVKECFGNSLYIIESTKSTLGLESTIIDLSSEKPMILRYGFITPETISTVLDMDVLLSQNSIIKAPGMLTKHYSPHTSLRLNATTVLSGEIGLGFGKNDIGELNLSHKGDLAEAAANYYSMIRLLDEKAIRHNIQGIAVAKIPDEGIGLAINDKLRRGSH